MCLEGEYQMYCTSQGTEMCAFCGHLSCSLRRQFSSICFVGHDDDDQPSMQSAWVCGITRGTGSSEHVKSTHEPLAVFRPHTNSNQYCPSCPSSSCTVVTFCASDTQSVAMDQHSELYNILWKQFVAYFPTKEAEEM